MSIIFVCLGGSDLRGLRERSPFDQWQELREIARVDRSHRRGLLWRKVLSTKHSMHQDFSISSLSPTYVRSLLVLSFSTLVFIFFATASDNDFLSLSFSLSYFRLTRNKKRSRKSPLLPARSVKVRSTSLLLTSSLPSTIPSW